MGRWRAAALAMLLAAGGVLAQSEVPGGLDRSKFDGYKPTDAVLARMNAERALNILREIAGEKPKSEEVQAATGASRLRFFVEGKALSTFRPIGEVRQVEIFEDRIELDINRTDRGPGIYYFHQVPQKVEIAHDYLVMFHYGVPLSDQWYLWCTDGGMFEEDRAGCAKLLADALYVLRKAGQSRPGEEEQFREVVAKYRALGARPALPEELRRFKVQAEFLIDQRRYADAIRVYAEGLKIAPWWPDGRFNRALLFAETKRYREAIQEMSRFLMLEPNAPEARAAQDSIYKWEAMAGPAGRPVK